MNEYEAQQGVNAQRLQADLNMIGSAVEGSQSETYRIHSVPREREDAEQQRRLANAALRSWIAAYAAHLDVITRSEAQQVQDTRLVGRASIPDAAEQRETQLLKKLSDSLPGLKSKAEDFIRLSDSFSQAEGEFVQEVFEPEVRGELTKTVQELTDETERAAENYRRSIEAVQKQSYRQTIVIVL